MKLKIPQEKPLKIKGIPLPISKEEPPKQESPFKVSYNRQESAQVTSKTEERPGHLEKLFEELLGYCQINSHKYEEAIQILKQREEERKANASCKQKVDKLKQQNKSLKETIEHTKTKTKGYKKQVEDLKRQLDLRFKATNDLLKEKKKLDETILDLQEVNKGLRNTMHDDRGHVELPKETRGRVRLNSSLDDGTSRSKMTPSPVYDLSFSLQGDTNFFRRLDGSQILVSKEIGDYIRRLLDKINRFSNKIKLLRNQRDKLKMAYDKYIKNNDSLVR